MDVSSHVETVCLLSKLDTEQHIEIDLNVEAPALTDVESFPTESV